MGYLQGMAQPAARVGDMTAHGTPADPGTGSINVMVGGQPAWRALDDACACPAHGPEIMLLGSTTVMINGRMTARVGDILQGNGPPNTIAIGATNVVIGDAGFGMAAPQTRAAFAREMKALLKDWDLLEKKGRLDALKRALAGSAPPGMPPLGVAAKAMSSSDTLGEMNFGRWQVDLNEKLLAGRMGHDKMAELSNTMYHEGRHGEQWFHVAQSRAAAGIPGTKIAKGMHVPDHVAAAAVASPAERGTSAGEMGTAVDISVYGGRSAHREAVLSDLGSPKPGAGTYEQYRALPEEEDAWRQGDACEVEYDRLSTKSP
jgi:uncharacterized Zn-binding protein involved in type VI secretion